MFGSNSGHYKHLELAKNIRFIAVVREIAHAMGTEKSAVLPLFHASTRCDTVEEGI